MDCDDVRWFALAYMLPLDTYLITEEKEEERKIELERGRRSG